MTMTAKELYEIVRDVPEDATPMIYYDLTAATWRDLKNHAQVLTPLAEAAFVGAMVAWLLKNQCQVNIGRATSDAVFVSVPNRAGHFVPSISEALAAACKATKQEDDGGN
jgi:hypothetical protein